MNWLRRSFVFAAAGTLWIAGCDNGPPPILFIPDTEAPPAEEKASGALKYPRGPEGLAEMNPHGLHHFRDGSAVRLHDRDPERDSTTFGRKAVDMLEQNAKRLSGFPQWRKLTGNEVFNLAERFRFSEEKDKQAIRVKLLGKAARMDHAEAQAHLARCYAKGLGVKKNYSDSVFWATKASQNGSGRGAHILFVCYFYGHGVKENKEVARQMLILAARRGFVWAQAVLGQELAGSDVAGFKTDQQAARKWLTVAASAPLNPENKSGKSAGLNGLGLLHEKGKGVPKNETEALAYYYLARSIAEEDQDIKVINRNIALREKEMSSSARQYSQLRAQELKPIYFDQVAATPPPPPAEQVSVGFGSGVFVTQQGHLLTAAHVVENAANVKAQVNEEVVEAEILAIDHPNDVALLKVNAKVDAAPVRSSAGVELGNDVFTIGFPNLLLQGTEPKFTEGTISSTSGMRDDPRQFQVSVQVQPGNSGGALFDEYGNVIGLVVARLDDEATSQLTGSLPQNVNYAVKSSYALPLLESLKADLLEEQRPSWFRRTDRQEVVSDAKKASVPLIVDLTPRSE
jgi:S1-C subfamily serine protease